MTSDHRDPGNPASEPRRSEPDEAVRRRAESRAGKEGDPWDAGDAPLSVDEAQKLQHTLTVHQIELERQNDELRRIQGELAASRQRYFELYDDVTTMKEKEDQRFQLGHRLQQAEKVESLGRMAGSVSHHFNNLLGVVIGNLELVRSERSTPAEPDDALDDALAAARAAAEVSTTLLGYLGQVREEQGPQDLSKIIRQSLPILRAAMPQGTDLDSDLPSPGSMVHANVEQIRQVLQNLVTNAWEAALPGHGLIRISVRKEYPQ